MIYFTLQFSYNLHAREKSPVPGEQALILIPDSTTSEMFSRWIGPAKVIEQKSSHSYIVEQDGVSRHIIYMQTNFVNIL